MASILHTNLLRDSNTYTILTDDTLTDYPVSNGVDGRSNTQVGFTGSNQEVVVDFGSSTTFDAIGFSRHNMGTNSATFEVEGSADNISYTALKTINPTNDNVIVEEFTSASYRYVKLTCSSGGTVYIADVFLAARKDLERSQKYGFIKPAFSDKDLFTPNVTRGNNIVGITVEPRPSRVVFNLFYYTASFFSDWATVVNEMKVHPIYILWKDSEQAYYCWPSKAIPEPRYSANNSSYYSVKLDMSGYIL